ncbi:MAG: DUF3883 domain-containing protein [Bacteroidota bacterium]|nr:DUF3883 domain-containing protein [Bacteroidota bacterium]
MSNTVIPSFNQLKALLQIIIEVQQRKEAHIRRRYLQIETGFPFVLSFLIAIRTLRIEDNYILIKDKKLKSPDTLRSDTNLKEYLCEKVLNTSDPRIRKELSFLKKFYFKEGSFKYLPTTKERLRESGIRNLLIELECITIIKHEKSYLILDKSENLFLQFLSKKPVTLDKFKSSQKNKEQIGTNGEQTIIAFEKDRLSRDSIYNGYKVKHVSQSNVSAGYDILSWDLNKKKGVVPRYIEVKVIPKQSVQFYLTNNELEKAKLYGNRYYLYLLPQKNKNQFELSKLKIIQDPYTHVFENPGDWDRHVDTYKFTYSAANEQ